MTVESAPRTGSVPTLMPTPAGIVPICAPIDFEVLALEVAESANAARSKAACMEIECAGRRSSVLTQEQLSEIEGLKEASAALAGAEESLAGAEADCTALAAAMDAAAAEFQAAEVALAAANGTGAATEPLAAAVGEAGARLEKAAAALDEAKVRLAAAESEVAAGTAEVEGRLAALDAASMNRVVEEIKDLVRDASRLEELETKERGEEAKRTEEARSAESVLAEFIVRMADDLAAEISARTASAI